MKKQFLIIIVFLFCYICIAQNRNNSNQYYRYKFQKYFDDSTHIFWTEYPNPLAHRGMRGDTSKIRICGDLDFYCDLSDSVEVAFVTENDSIVYRTIVFSKYRPDFGVCYWIAGNKARKEILPSNYFKPNKDGIINILLIVNNQKKSMRTIGIPVKAGQYYWIQPLISGEK